MSREHSAELPQYDGAPSEQRASCTVGRHLIADLSGIAPRALQDELSLMSLFDQVLRTAGCQVLSRSSHKFPGADSGVTGFFLLTESHAAFHSYPEHGYLAVDIFVCGEVDPQQIVAAIGDVLEATHIDSRLLPRRVESDGGTRRMKTREDLGGI